MRIHLLLVAVVSLSPLAASAQTMPSFPAAIPTAISGGALPAPKPDGLPLGTGAAGGGLDVKGTLDSLFVDTVFPSLCSVVLQDPGLAVAACKEAVDVRYEKCKKDTGGDPLVTFYYEDGTSRQIHKCATDKKFGYEVCEAVPDIAGDISKACQDKQVSLFPLLPGGTTFNSR